MKKVAITFDYWADVYTTAFQLMKARGMVGTFFVAPDTVDKSGGPTVAALLDMKASGWSIGAYSDVNMADLYATDKVAALTKLNELKAAMAKLGFPTDLIAPSQRAWNVPLNNLASGLFTKVRTCTQQGLISNPQALPLTDKWVDKGGTPSMSSTDTASSCSLNVSDFLSSSGNLWTLVGHHVGGTFPPWYTVSESAFISLLDKLASSPVVVAGYDSI